MARQHIDTTPPTGDPAPTAFNKINAMTEELYPLAVGAAQRGGANILTNTWQWAYGGATLRITNDGGNAVIQSVSAAGTAFDTMRLGAANFQLDAGSGNFQLNANQLRVDGAPIPVGLYGGYILGRFAAKPGSNSDFLDWQYYRAATTGSTSWPDFNWRIGRSVDATTISYIEFLGNRNILLNTSFANFTFQTNGNAVAQGSWVNGGSDPAIKQQDSLRSLENATAAVCGLNVRLGKYLPEFNPDERERAFVMADDAMREHTPEVIIEEVIEGKYAGWATDQLIAYLVAAYQEARARELECLQTVSAIEHRLKALELAV